MTVDWKLFTDSIERVPATAIDPADPFMTYITLNDNVHTWSNFLINYKQPTVAEVSMANDATRWQIPFLSIVLLLILALAFHRFRVRLRHHHPVRLYVAIMTLLSASAVMAYSYAQLAVSRPAVFVADISNDEALDTLQSLLKNVYRAFDFREEKDLDDKLALSVSGELLADIYLHNRKTFAANKRPAVPRPK